jgi:multiple sugar transport system permease protein
MLLVRHFYATRRDRTLSWLFLLPVFLVLAIAALIPLAYGLGLSFTNYDLSTPVFHSKFVGFANYIELFRSQLFQQSVRNNFVFALLSVSLELVAGTILAMMLASDSRLTRFITTIVLIPMVIAPVASGTLWRMMLDRTYGVVNYLLHFLGIPAIGWLSDFRIAIYAVIFVDFWQFTPYVAILVLSSIKAIPLSLVDSARVDGASLWKVFTSIIFPLIAPVVIVVAMIRFIDAFKVFDTVYVMTQGGPGNATLMLPNYIFQQGIQFFKVAYSTATAFVFIIAMFLLSAVFIRLRTVQLRRLG